MKKNLLTLISIFLFGVLCAQTKQSELILGTWIFEKEVDLRTNVEKSNYVEIPWCPYETTNGTGYPDLIFKKNNIIEKYYTEKHIEFGKWEIKKNEILIYRLIENEKTEINSTYTKYLLKRKSIFKGNDGNYYFKPYKLKIKKISKNRVEFGNRKEFSIYKRIEQKVQHHF